MEKTDKILLWVGSFCVIFLLLGAFGYATAIPAEIDSAVLVHYLMDESSVPYVDNADNTDFNTTDGGGSPSQVTGIEAYTYSQDFAQVQNDRISTLDLSSGNPLYGHQNITVAVWMYLDTDPVGQPQNFFYANYYFRDATDRFGWNCWISKNVGGHHLCDFWNLTTNRDEFESTTTVPVGSWVHVTWSYAPPDNFYLWYNGTLQGHTQTLSAANGLAYDSSEMRLFLGDTHLASHSWANRDFDGKMTGFTYFDRTLNTTEVQYIMLNSYPYFTNITTVPYLKIANGPPAKNAINNTVQVNVTFTPSTNIDSNLSCTLQAQERTNVVHGYNGAAGEWGGSGIPERTSTGEVQESYWTRLTTGAGINGSVRVSRVINEGNCSTADTFSYWVKVADVDIYWTHPATYIGDVWGFMFIGHDVSNSYYQAVNRDLNIINKSGQWYEVASPISSWNLSGSVDIERLNWTRIYTYSNGTSTWTGYDKLTCYNSSAITRQTNFLADIINNTKTVLNFTATSDGDWEYWKNCTNNQSLSNRSIDKYYTLDTNEPLIVMTYPTENNITRIEANRSLALNGYTTDVHLFRTNFTILNETGMVMYNDYQANLTGQTQYDWNATIDMSSWQAGTYTWLAEASDSHTKNKIKDAKRVTKDVNNRKLKYEFEDEDIEVTLKTNHKLLDINTVKEEDRYTFDFDFENEVKKNTKLVFTVVSKNYKITQLPGSEFAGHLVIANGMKGYWLDLEGVDADYTITRVTDYEYEIDVDLNEDVDNIKFKSLGGLNYNNKTGTLLLQVNITVQVNDTGSGTLLQNFSATAGSFGATAVGTDAVIWVDPNATYTVDTSIANYFVLAQNIDVAFSSVSVLLNATSAGVLLVFIDEQTLNKVTSETINIELTGNTTESYTTSTGEQLITGLAFGVYSIKYWSSSYLTRYRFAVLNTTSNVNLTLYMLNNTGTDVQLVDFTVQDYATAQYVEDALLTVTRTIAGGGGDLVVVGEAYTDFVGSARFAMVTTQEYIINITHPDYTSRTISVTPIETDYTILLVGDVLNVTYTTVFDFVNINFYPRFNVLNKSIWTFWLTTASYYNGTGNIDYFSVYSTFNGTDVDNETTSLSGGTVNISKDLTNHGGQTFDVTYCIKAIGISPYCFIESYFVESLNASVNRTLVDLVKETRTELEAGASSERGGLILSAIALFIIVILTLVITQMGVEPKYAVGIGILLLLPCAYLAIFTWLMAIIANFVYFTGLILWNAVY